VVVVPPRATAVLSETAGTAPRTARSAFESGRSNCAPDHETV